MGLFPFHGTGRFVVLPYVAQELSLQIREGSEYLCLANYYAGRFCLLYESELSLTFGMHLAVGKRSDRGSALRLGTC
jgi:hypothetical protein